jgi:hypothetical protein
MFENAEHQLISSADSTRDNSFEWGQWITMQFFEQKDGDRK